MRFCWLGRFLLSAAYVPAYTTVLMMSFVPVHVRSHGAPQATNMRPWEPSLWICLRNVFVFMIVCACACTQPWRPTAYKRAPLGAQLVHFFYTIAH